MNYLQWLGTFEDYEYLKEELGGHNVRQVYSLSDNCAVRVYDSHRDHEVLLRPGSVVCWKEQEIWVE